MRKPNYKEEGKQEGKQIESIEAGEEENMSRKKHPPRRCRN